MKTAKELDIPQTVFDALVLTLDLFEHGNAVYARPIRASASRIDWQPLPRSEGPPPSLFNMLVWEENISWVCEENISCGTVRCIGGWTEWFSVRGGGTLKFILAAPPDGLSALFYPPNPVDWKLITVAQAAAAIRSYLETGDPAPAWEQAHAEHQRAWEKTTGAVDA